MFNWFKKEKNVGAILLPEKLPDIQPKVEFEEQTYFKMSLDADGNIFVDINCVEGDEENLATMCTALNNGSFSDMIVYGIENGLKEEQAAIVLDKMFEDNKKLLTQMNDDNNDEDPVVSPLIALQVLNGQNNRE